VGDVVNLENDVVGKYVEHLLTFGAAKPFNQPGLGADAPAKEPSGGITREFLLKNGF
jgi:hypothetical protein